jgi:predicted enzyme related to lactoylglutathione lyase
MGCPVIEWQILAKSPDAAITFYGGLFDWTADSNNALGYRRVNTGTAQGIHGGIWPSPADGQNFVQLFIAVDSVPEYHRRAEQMGAKTLVPPQKLPDGDELAIMIDPQGIPFGLIKKA